MGAMEAIAADHPLPCHAPVHESLPSYYLVELHRSDLQTRPPRQKRPSGLLRTR
jgi:hypothetical protein